MKIYKISCYSGSGSYFIPYLQSVTVIANNTDDAISYVKKWLSKKNESFIKSESEWIIDELTSTIEVGEIVDYEHDSDY